jgi:hypothetical protein
LWGGGPGGGGGGGGQGGEMNQALYAHMNNKTKMKKKKRNFRMILFQNKYSIPKYKKLLFLYFNLLQKRR